MKNVDDVIKKIKDCTFDTDAEENLTKGKIILELKIRLTKKLFDLELGYHEKRNELLMSDEVQKGKNAETRNAIIELELAGTEFDSIDEYKMLLGIIRSVETFNDKILIMFFKGE